MAEKVNIRMDRSAWDQITRDLEKFYGRDVEETEVWKSVELQRHGAWYSPVKEWRNLNDEYTSKVYLGESHDKSLSVQYGDRRSTCGCGPHASHCGRCGGCSSYQGHYFSYCKITKMNREFHFCCPDDCELGTTQ